MAPSKPDSPKAPPSPDQLISTDSGLPSLDDSKKATSSSVKPLSARADLPWERAISRKSSIVKQYDIYWVNLDPTNGQEIKKTRPCIIVSPNVMNDALGTIMAVPLTSTIIDWPFRTIIRLDSKRSSAACDQLRTISRERLRKRVGKLSATERRNVSDILRDIFAE